MLQTKTPLDGGQPTPRGRLQARAGALRLPYVAAHYGKSLLWCASESMFAYLLTELAHLPPMAVGCVLAVSYIVSGALDIGVGTAFRQQLSTIAACSRLQLVGAVTAAAALLMLFSVPVVHPAMPLVAAASVILLFRLAYAFVDLPQNAMLSLLVENDARMSLASLRLVASGLAALTVGAWASTIVYSSASHRPLLLIPAALTIAAITVGSSGYLRRRVRAWRGGLHSPIRAPFVVPGRLPVSVWRLILVMLVINSPRPFLPGCCLIVRITRSTTRCSDRVRSRSYRSARWRGRHSGTGYCAGARRRFMWRHRPWRWRRRRRCSGWRAGPEARCWWSPPGWWD